MTCDPIKVLYFTRVSIDNAENGGNICCRNHLIRLRRDDGVRLWAVAAGPPEWRDGTTAFFREHDIEGEFIPDRPGQTQREHDLGTSSIPYLTKQWPYLHEILALQQCHIDRIVVDVADRVAPDCVIVDYLPSAFFVRTIYRSRFPVITTTLNREGSFFRDLRRHVGSLYGRPTTWVTEMRMRMAEIAVHRRSHAIVTIGRYDRPWWRRSQWMPPYLDPKPDEGAWSGTDSRSIFFVGNIGHFPNAEAVRWLATVLAPRLKVLAPEVSIKIVGAATESVPSNWRGSNVVYLGRGDAQMLSTLFRNEAAMIAPISNSYGAKFKVAEAISYGTPLLVPESALSGVPFLPWLPRLDLKDAARAAESVTNLARDRAAQMAMSSAIRGEASRFAGSQQTAWSRCLRELLSGTTTDNDAPQRHQIQERI